MEGSSTASKRLDDSTSSSGGAEAAYTSPSSSTSNAAATTRGQGLPGPPSMPTVAYETIFRLLCSSDKSGSVIGKGGGVVRQIQEETGARVRIEDRLPGSDDRVVRVVADAILRRKKEGVIIDIEEEPSPAQRALLRVFERIVRGEEGEGGDKEVQGTASCRLLAPSTHVGCVLGKGGKIVEKIRLESGAKIRIFSKESVPLCAVAGDELIQISGSLHAVKKALLLVTSCLQDNIRADPTSFSNVKPYMGSLQGPAPHPPFDAFPQRGYLASPFGLDYHHRVYSSNPPLDNTLSGPKKLPEEEVSFRLLCMNDKVGSIIGKSGSIVQSLRSETGAAIKVVDAVTDSDDRIILISAYEVSGNFQSVREALVHITNRIRETFFPPQHYSNIGMSQYRSVMQEVMPPYMPRNDVRHAAVGFPHVLDSSIESPRNLPASSPKLLTQSGTPKVVAAGSATQADIASSKTVTIAVPQHYIGFVHGESDGSLALIREVSGANVTIHDPKPGTHEGTVIISGSQKQTSTAQALVHAFILNEL